MYALLPPTQGQRMYACIVPCSSGTHLPTAPRVDIAEGMDTWDEHLAFTTQVV